MKPKLKVVFDTNIYISAIIFGGNPRQCLELARNKEINLFYSKAILLELSDKLQNKFNWSVQEVIEVLEGIAQSAYLVDPEIKVSFIKSDPSDNRVLEAALEAKADYIITGDKKHLLSQAKFQKIPILSAKQFLEAFYNQLKR